MPQHNTNRPLPTLTMTFAVVVGMMESIGLHPPERGGVFGSTRPDRADHWYFDAGAAVSSGTYSPDIASVNRLFQTDWNPQRVRLTGFCHSHPGEMNCLSPGDEVYAADILRRIPDLDRLWLPIVTMDAGLVTITPWAATLGPHGLEVLRGRLRVDLPNDADVADPIHREYLSQLSADAVDALVLAPPPGGVPGRIHPSRPTRWRRRRW